MEKYYTPQIEEFCVGFEYEYFSEGLSDLDIDGISGWYKTKFTFDIEKYEQRSPTKKVRVKFLDKDDIESLGFSFESTNKIRNWYKGPEEWFNETIPGSPSGRYWGFTLIHDPEFNVCIIESMTNSGETERFFEGIIKNKSELKKLLKQLGVNG